jgi:hypothetical protein
LPSELGFERLHAAILAACAGCEDFPGRLAAALRATLGLLADEPDLARLLTVQPYLDGGEEALRAQRRWLRHFGDLLRDAAAAYPEANPHPRFLEPFLIGGIRFQIARQVLTGEAAQLQSLLPSTLQFLLAFYFAPQEVGRIACAATADGDGARG